MSSSQKLPRKLGGLLWLGLIIWKNLLLRKRQWLVSFFEFVFPVLMALTIWGACKPDGNSRYYDALTSGSIYQPNKPTPFVIRDSDLYWDSTMCQSRPPNANVETENFIAYSPKNTETDRVMRRLASEICRYGTSVNYFGLSTAKDLETKYYNSWKTNKNFQAAVVFSDGLEALRGSPSSGEVKYKIRMNPSCLSSTNKLFPEKRVDEDFTKVGPNEANEKIYKNCRFLDIQWNLDKVLWKEITGQAQLTHALRVKSFPYPHFKEESEYPPFYNIKAWLLLCVAIGWSSCFLLPSITRNVVGEKQTGIAELLRLTGVPGWVQWIGWMIHVIAPQICTILFTTLVVCFFPFSLDDKPLIIRGDFTLVAAILLLHMLSSVAVGFLICSVCQKPTIATAIGVLLALGSLIAGVLYMIDGKIYPEGVPFFLSFFPNFAFVQLWERVLLWDYLVDDESDLPYGARWSILTPDEPVDKFLEKNGVPSLYLMLIMLVETFVCMLLAIYLDGVLPFEHGVGRPWYFFNCDRAKRQPPVVVPEVEPIPEIASTEISSPDHEPEASTADSKVSSAVADKPSVAPTKNNEEEVVVVSSFEPEPAGVPVGIEIQNIYKKFGLFKMAVNGVSLRMFTGDIFALLGHNGAGKTTLISMLTGFFSPTTGTAFINGYDIRQSMDKARESMGLCPQHNMLFNNLTCGEQLILFGMLRGLTKLQATNEMKMLLFRMNIPEKESTLASKLSGGQKRKLSLGIALIGGTRVVVLDEPTSGMDPQARREIWDLLLQLRGERTILLTTHFMEEADVLGDRIGIMANGQLQCCGTSSFLKKFYGTGYTLKLTLNVGAFAVEGGQPEGAISEAPSQQDQTVVVDIPQEQRPVLKPSSAAEAVLAAVQKHVPNASFKTDARVDFASNEVFLCLPNDTASTSVLMQLVTDLTARKDKLAIKTIGLAQTTMDEVFVRVGESGHPQKDDELEDIERAPKQTKNQFIGQFLSLLMKMLIYSMRKWVLLMFQVLVPFALFLVAAHVSYNFAKPYLLNAANREHGIFRTVSERAKPDKSVYTGRHNPMLISLSSYEKEKPVTFYSGSDLLGQVIGSSGKRVGDVTEEILRVGRDNRISYKRRHVVAAELLGGNTIQTLYNLFPYHSAPLAINIASNFLLKAAKKDVQIQATSHPFDGPSGTGDPNYRSSSSGRSLVNPFPYYERSYKKNDTIHSKWKRISYPFAFTFPLGIILLVANFVVQPIEERLCKVKQLQTMTGVSPLVYWGASFTYDFGIYFVIIFLMLMYMVIADSSTSLWVFTPNTGWLVFLIICMAYGFGAIIFCYLVSLRASSVTGGYSLVMLVQLFMGVFLGLILPDTLAHVEWNSISFTPLFFYWVFYLLGRCFPSFSFVRAMWYYAQTSASNTQCPLLAVNPKECPEPLNYWKFFTVANKTDYVRVQTSKYSGEYKEVKVGEYLIPGVLLEILVMIFVDLVYLGWLMLVEYKVCRGSTRQLLPEEYSAFAPNIYDDDVFNEVERVNELIFTGQIDTECLLVKELCKNYGNFAAVSNLHFGVHYGECFGLLGVNGAGKTTAFRMITGDEVPAKGNAYGFGTSLEINPNRFFANIGYCPQVDAIMEHFTGKEMLELFAGLRGVPFKMRGNEALRWLRRMGLSESANVKCGRYSGGMKRRLSTAMAMIGDPALILLDEPTSGVDPVSRRQFWSIMDKLRATGQSIILTSHSMEECEALCSRLGIMVNGQFQCFGGVQHLKNKFAQGYSLTIKLKQDLTFDNEEIKFQIDEFQGKILERFQPCELKDKHQNLMNFHLQDPSITWDVLFKSMEEVKAEYESLIEDYSVNETSLEEVFLAFARMQYPERKAGVSLCKQICTCSC